MRRLMDEHRRLPADSRSLAGRLPAANGQQGAISVWRVEIHGGKGHVQQRIVTIGVSHQGERRRPLERIDDCLHSLEPSEQSVFNPDHRCELVRSALPEMIRRELAHAGVLAEDASFSAKLLAWVEVT